MSPDLRIFDDWRGRFGRDSAETAISRTINRLLRGRAARVPSQVRTDLSSELAIVALRDCLTVAEKTAAARGHGPLVRRTRAVLYNAIIIFDFDGPPSGRAAA